MTNDDFNTSEVKMYFEKGNYNNTRKHLAKLGCKAILYNKSVSGYQDGIKFENLKHLSKEVVSKIKYKECMWKVYKNLGTDINYRSHRGAGNAATAELKRSQAMFEIKLSSNIKTDIQYFLV